MSLLRHYKEPFTVGSAALLRCQWTHYLLYKLAKRQLISFSIIIIVSRRADSPHLQLQQPRDGLQELPPLRGQTKQRYRPHDPTSVLEKFKLANELQQLQEIRGQEISRRAILQGLQEIYRLKIRRDEHYRRITDVIQKSSRPYLS